MLHLGRLGHKGKSTQPTVPNLPSNHPSVLPDGERVLVCLQVIYVLGIPLEADGRRELHVQFGRLLPGLARVSVVQREALEQLPIVPRKGDMQDNT